MQMPTLEPGTYLLMLSAPVDAAPVRAKPALVGLVPPDTGPPEDVVKAYLSAPAEEAGTSFTARHVEAPSGSEVEGDEADDEATDGSAPEEQATEEPAAGDEGDQAPPENPGESAEGGLS
jgi:hypothetical protein